jgi:ATP-dependent DNA helicase RecG
MSCLPLSLHTAKAKAKTELRWVDRLVPDGTWSGNLFDFYRRVYRKLVEDLKVPFAFKGDQRQDDTPVHEALREALVNTLVHADYTGRVSVLVVKRPDLFGFRNPGGLRLPLEQVLQGGISDCRNRLMHQIASNVSSYRSRRARWFWGSKNLQRVAQPALATASPL